MEIIWEDGFTIKVRDEEKIVVISSRRTAFRHKYVQFIPENRWFVKLSVFLQ